LRFVASRVDEMQTVVILDLGGQFQAAQMAEPLKTDACPSDPGALRSGAILVSTAILVADFPDRRYGGAIFQKMPGRPEGRRA
jgi:hypothetical protein